MKATTFTCVGWLICPEGCVVVKQIQSNPKLCTWYDGSSELINSLKALSIINRYLKSNPWFDEECREALKARRALDKRVRHSRELRGETISAFRRSQAKARRLFNQEKRQSWAEYASKLSAETPIKHVLDRVREYMAKTSALPSNI